MTEKNSTEINNPTSSDLEAISTTLKQNDSEEMA